MDAPNNEWRHISDVIYKPDGTFNSGSAGGAGREGSWAKSTNFPDLTRVKQILFGVGWAGPFADSNIKELYIDNVFFQFSYSFSPVVAQNSGSQGVYGRRYEVLEYPFMVTDVQASGILIHELNSRMGSKQVAEFIVKDNPKSAINRSVQIGIYPGQVLQVDAPSLNTGSGQLFHYWKIIDVRHDYSTQNGFITSLRGVPWFSGTVVAPNSNLIDYSLPLKYIENQEPRRWTDRLPANWPFYSPN